MHALLQLLCWFGVGTAAQLLCSQALLIIAIEPYMLTGQAFLI